MAAAVVVRRLVGVLWKRLYGEAPPKTPTAEGAAWSTAIVWAIVSGTTAGLARLVGRRSAIASWRRLLDEELPRSPLRRRP